MRVAAEALDWAAEWDRVTSNPAPTVAAPDRNSRRLMILLHGLGDSMDGWRWFPEAMKLPWLNYLLVNAPDENIRRNRLTLLCNLLTEFSAIADFSEIVPSNT